MKVAKAGRVFTEAAPHPAASRFCCSPMPAILPPHAAGNKIVNVDPRPNRLSTLIVPPILSTTCFTIDSPNPVPPTARDRALSTR